LLGATARASLVHCTLPPGGVSLVDAHHTVEDIWTIPTGAHFQFRTIGPTPLRIIIATMPPWPGEQEAYRVPDHWPRT
jgi:mannose-6-phosphate isomerase-like protein (cupin superfamily)